MLKIVLSHILASLFDIRKAEGQPPGKTLWQKRLKTDDF